MNYLVAPGSSRRFCELRHLLSVVAKTYPIERLVILSAAKDLSETHRHGPIRQEPRALLLQPLFRQLPPFAHHSLKLRLGPRRHLHQLRRPLRVMQAPSDHSTTISDLPNSSPPSAAAFPSSLAINCRERATYAVFSAYIFSSHSARPGKSPCIRPAPSPQLPPSPAVQIVQRSFRRLQSRPGRIQRSRIHRTATRVARGIRTRSRPASRARGSLRRHCRARPQAILGNYGLRRRGLILIFLRRSSRPRRIRHRRLPVLRLRKPQGAVPIETPATINTATPNFANRFERSVRRIAITSVATTATHSASALSNSTESTPAH